MKPYTTLKDLLATVAIAEAAAHWPWVRVAIAIVVFGLLAIMVIGTLRLVRLPKFSED